MATSRDALASSHPVPAVLPASARALPAGSANDPDQLVGIRDQAIDLANKVKAVTDTERDMKLKVFSIVGFGGLGKTTLAMEVCRQLKADFHRQAFLSVSQAFDAGKDLLLLPRPKHKIIKASTKR
jgi:disease resistance protein RPM1